MHTTAEVVSPFAQILSLGLIWTLIHCSPMCGPIVSGLRLGAGKREISPFCGLIFYQVGRGLMYSVFGGLSGLFGSKAFESPKLSWALVAIIGLMFIYQAFPRFFAFNENAPDWLIRSLQRAQNLPAVFRALAFGILFSFLPCMLVFWALTLAAATKNFIHGAALMLTLVSLTTLPLLLFTVTSRRIVASQKQIAIPLMGISFLWTLLVTLGANDLISHFHFSFEVFNQSYTMMFW